MKQVTDFHRHFTGALPAWFICAEASRRRAEPQVRGAIRKLVGVEVLSIESLRAACTQALARGEPAYQAFFELYELIQAITKPCAEDHDAFYFRAGRALAIQARREGIRAHLIMGAHPDIGFLTRRIRNTIRGIEAVDATASSVQLRITFVRNFDGTYKNLSAELIDDCFALIERDSALRRRLRGFDFCGVERPEEPREIFNALEQIYIYNKHRAARHLRRVDVSVHAGEDLVHSSPAAQLAFLENLCSIPFGPKTIAHGTILWIRDKDFSLDAAQRRQREACLRAMASRRIALEVCPTANLRMTPLRNRSCIPINELVRAGVEVRIGSDNPVLLATTIRREIKHAWRGQ